MILIIIIILWYTSTNYKGVFMKKLLFVVILSLLFVVLNGCGEKVYPSYITAENIYAIESDKYFVYFEKENCSQCEATLPSVIDYLTKTKNKKDSPYIYRVLLEFTDENGELVKLPISRALDENSGQGPNGNFYVDGVKNWVALYIAATPSLIEVTNVDGTRQSKLVAVGTTEIETYLTNLQNGK